MRDVKFMYTMCMCIFYFYFYPILTYILTLSVYAHMIYGSEIGQEWATAHELKNKMHGFFDRAFQL